MENVSQVPVEIIIFDFMDITGVASLELGS
jgi:hypothetical protein